MMIFKEKKNKQTKKIVEQKKKEIKLDVQIHLLIY